MAFRDHELEHVTDIVSRFIEARRPPPEIRDQVDLAYRIVNQNVDIYEVRPAFRSPGKTMETPIARVTYVRSQFGWRIMWMRQDLKWHTYEPDPFVRFLQQALAIVSEDKYGCFWG
jgi:hypothetical protein